MIDFLANLGVEGWTIVATVWVIGWGISLRCMNVNPFSDKEKDIHDMITLFLFWPLLLLLVVGFLCIGFPLIGIFEVLRFVAGLFTGHTQEKIRGWL